MLTWNELPLGNSRIPCPLCSRGLRDRTMGVTLDQRSGVAHCFRCEYVQQTQSAPTHRQPVAVLRPRGRIFVQLSDLGQALWANCRELHGTAGEVYLRARGCALPPSGSHLRFHPLLKHPMLEHTGPALVGLITDAKTGQPISLHRTWITASAHKANVSPARMLLGRHRKDGGVIRLWPDDAIADGRLGVAEGIETALSLAHRGVPTWSLIDAGNMTKFAVIEPVSTLLIAVDHDAAGLQAASQCAQRWRLRGKTVEEIIPPLPGQDLNDLYRSHHAGI